MNQTMMPEPSRERLEELMELVGLQRTFRMNEDYKLAREAYRSGWDDAQRAADEQGEREARQKKDYAQLMTNQGHVCDICHLPPPVGFRLIADEHDGQLRGLLCVGCYGMVGRVRSLGLPRIESYLGR